MNNQNDTQLSEELLGKQQDAIIDSTIDTVRGIRNAINYQGKLITDHGRQYDQLDNHLDRVVNKGKKTSTKM